MVRRHSMLAALVALVGTTNLFASISGTQTAFRHLYTLNHTGRVAIQNFYGNVTVTAWDRDEVLVEAIKHSSDSKRLDDARIVVETTAGALTIRTQYAGSDAEHPTSVEYRITVPRSITLESVVLTNGQLSLNGLTGAVKASAVNGDIHAWKLGGMAELSTINGQVEADFDHTSRNNPISLSSVNGPIHLTIPSGSGASLVAQNLSGGIASNVGHVSRTPAGHRLLVRGTGGAQIHLKNVNGGISIHSECACT